MGVLVPRLGQSPRRPICGGWETEGAGEVVDAAAQAVELGHRDAVNVLALRGSGQPVEQAL